MEFGSSRLGNSSRNYHPLPYEENKSIFGAFLLLLMCLRKYPRNKLSIHILLLDYHGNAKLTIRWRFIPRKGSDSIYYSISSSPAVAPGRIE